jgi:hypothetical protein
LKEEAMKSVPTIVVSLLVGVGVGYGIARLMTSNCADHLIVANPNATSAELGDRSVCKEEGHLVTWRAKNAANVKVEWVSIEPAGTTYPYKLDCTTFGPSCFSGPLLPDAKLGSKAKFKVEIENGKTFNGRIIIEK